MGDLAKAANLSRPALYLVFPSKVQIFTAVITRVFAEMLREIREGMHGIEYPAEQLMFAFEVWCVRPFEIIKASPDAADLLENGYKLAGNVTQSAVADFQKIIVDLFRSAISDTTATRATPAQAAQILVNATYGLKTGAKNAVQLRKMLRGLIELLLAGLGAHV